MILLLRLVFGGLLVSGLLCFAVYAFTGQPVWRQRGVAIVKWTLIAAAGFAAAILLPRLAPLL
jgi:hypothetical protein